jgi:LPXTG-site transpeptidase (sortase) family protein
VATKKQASHTVIKRAKPATVPTRQMRSKVLMRKVAVVQRKRVGGRRRRNVQSTVLATLAALLFVAGIGIGGLQMHTNQKVKAQVQTLAAHAESQNDDNQGDGAATGGDVPSEQKPTGTYRAAPEAPRTLKIAKIGVDARVIRLGVKSNNELKAPGNIHDAGWYEGSARPGELGAVLLDGHVHGPTQPGVFANLKKLKAGDKISLARGDGKVFTYTVAKSQSYDADKVDMGAAFNSAAPGKPGLNIITCDGAYDEDGHYNKRLVVFAVQD